MVRTIGLFWIVVQPSMLWPQSLCRCLFFGCWCLEWPIWWHPGYKWFQRGIFLALELFNQKGSGGRSLGLQQWTNSPSHTGLYWLWVLSTGYSRYTHHQSDHQCDQVKWNRWVVRFPEWIEDSPIVGMSVSRTFDSEGNCHKLNCRSSWLEQGGQNNKEGRSGCFLSKIINSWMKTHSWETTCM